MNFMGIDVGTTGVKTAVFNESGSILGYAFQNYDIIFGEGKYAEQDAENVWKCTKKTMAAAAASAGGSISAISLSTQGDAVIPVDRNRAALNTSILGMDYRTEPEANRCTTIFGDYSLFKKTGMRPHPLNSLTKMMWFQEHCPQLEGKLWKYTTYADYILLKLGADEPVIDLSMASRVMALDLASREWDTDILNKTGVPLEFLSKPVPSGVIVGKIGKTLAEETGISKDAVIVSGGHDQPCAALGAGAVKEGIALDSHGTAEVLSTTLNCMHVDDCMYSSYFPCTYHVVPDRFFTFALNHTSGLLLQWLRDTFCFKDVEEAKRLGIDPYTYMIESSPNAPASVMVLPHFNGSGTPLCDLNSKGAFVGLTMDTTRADIIKAMLDSLSYEMKINLERLDEANIRITKLRSVGGAARSEKWMQIKADILGCTVETLAVREAACLGAAMIAASASGAYNSLMEATSMVQVNRKYEPNDSNKQLYESKYSIYCKIYDSLRQLNHML